MRDSRRRRIMFRDEQEFDSQDETAVETSLGDFESEPSTEYTSGARVENQPKLIDFVPTKTFMIVGIFLMLVSVVALLNIAHFKILPLAIEKGISAGSLELSLDKGLLSWVASFLLLATAFFCFQVFQVRRFRADDFSGSYRVWIWLAAGFIIASIDATARISPIVASLIAANWEQGVLANDRNVWLMIVGIPAAVVGFRLLIELWRSRVAIGSIAVAGLAYLFANVLRMEMLGIPPERHAIVEANSVVTAHCFLFFTVVSYARFVLLESQGKISVSAVSDQAESSRDADVAEDDAADKLAQTSGRKRQSKTTTQLEETKKKDQKAKPGQAPKKDQSDKVETESGEEADETPTLKLMGQSVESKRGKKKRKPSQQSRRRAA